MNKGLSMRESSSSSQPARPTAPLPFDLRDSQDAPRLWWQQLAAHQVEVGQREEAEGARQVLGDAAIPDLGESPQALHHVERVLAAGAGSRPHSEEGFVLTGPHLPRGAQDGGAGGK